MRKERQSFKGFCNLDDLTQRRATRSATSTSPDEKSEDEKFEAYLIKMARLGVYGGHPELVAFCQVYDQDVTVHLPKDSNFAENPMSFTNTFRDQKPAPQPLHIAYAGDDGAICTGHYDSARNRDGSHPPNSMPQTPEVHTTSAPSSDSETGNHIRSITAPTARAIRSGRSELSHDLQTLTQKSRREADNSFDGLSPRARSNSISSSHRSSSSKRSLDDDGDNTRRKRADRRKSKGKRTEMSIVSYEYDEDHDAESPTDTPASTQDTETSSGIGDQNQSGTDDDYQPGQASDSDTARIRKRKIIKPSSRAALTKSSTLTKSTHQVKIPERPRPTAQT